jgi:hypothetical protein
MSSKAAGRSGIPSGILHQVQLKWQLGSEVRSFPGPALDPDRPAESLDAVGQTYEARTA